MLYVHGLVLRFRPGHDRRALGGAVTQALCGHWEHEGPCRWPHRTEVSGCDDGSLVARVLFDCAPDEERAVRTKIVTAAERGWLDGPTGRSEWTVERERPEAVSAADADDPPRNPS